jgi:hypothetical protein
LSFDDELRHTLHRCCDLAEQALLFILTGRPRAAIAASRRCAPVATVPVIRTTPFFTSTLMSLNAADLTVERERRPHQSATLSACCPIHGFRSQVSSNAQVFSNRGG